MVNAYQRLLPFYYVHAVGVQANYIDLARDWNVFFKWENEYKAMLTRKGTPSCLDLFTRFVSLSRRKRLRRRQVSAAPPESGVITIARSSNHYTY